jgi:hypothetical protein
MTRTIGKRGTKARRHEGMKAGRPIIRAQALLPRPRRKVALTAGSAGEAR